MVTTEKEFLELENMIKKITKVPFTLDEDAGDDDKATAIIEFDADVSKEEVRAIQSLSFKQKMVVLGKDIFETPGSKIPIPDKAEEVQKTKSSNLPEAVKKIFVAMRKQSKNAGLKTATISPKAILKGEVFLDVTFKNGSGIVAFRQGANIVVSYLKHRLSDGRDVIVGKVNVATLQKLADKLLKKFG